jgi:hypothetical protein
MKSGVIIAALAASFAVAEPEARAEPLPVPAPQRQIGAILGILGMANQLQAKSKAGIPKAGIPKGDAQCACPASRATDAYCKNNNEVLIP